MRAVQLRSCFRKCRDVAAELLKPLKSCLTQLYQYGTFLRRRSFSCKAVYSVHTWSNLETSFVALLIMKYYSYLIRTDFIILVYGHFYFLHM